MAATLRDLTQQAQRIADEALDLNEPFDVKRIETGVARLQQLESRSRLEDDERVLIESYIDQLLTAIRIARAS